MAGACVRQTDESRELCGIEIARPVFFIAKRTGLFQYRAMLVRTLLNLAAAILVIGLGSCCCLF
ncbi:MAG: hypothetical protein ACO3JG_05085 [Luteolibacter sp.]